MKTVSKQGECQVQELHFSRKEATDIDLVYLSPSETEAGKKKAIILLAYATATPPYLDKNRSPVDLTKQLLANNYAVAFLKTVPSIDQQDHLSIFYSTYNRTYLQERVRDLVFACHSLKSIQLAKTQIILCGTGRAGLWSLLAAPAADAVIADCWQLDTLDDAKLLAPDLFCPGIRNIDTFIGAPMLAAPNSLLLHNLSAQFEISPLQEAYKSLKRNNSFVSQSAKATDREIADWIFQLNQLK